MRCEARQAACKVAANATSGTETPRLPPCQHWQNQAPRRFLRWSRRFETQFRVDRNCPSVFRVRIGCDNGNTRIKKGPHPRADKRGSMPDTDHFGVSDVLVNSPRPIGKFGKMMIFPAMHGIVLHEGKGALIRRDYPARYPRIAYVFLIVGFIRVPPFANMRMRLPLDQQIEIIDCRLTKFVSSGRHHSDSLADHRLAGMGPLRSIAAN